MLTSQMLSSGVEVWICQTEGCEFETVQETEAYDHSVECGVNADKRVVVPGLEQMVADLRRQVRAEAIDEVVSFVRTQANRLNDAGQVSSAKALFGLANTILLREGLE